MASGDSLLMFSPAAALLTASSIPGFDTRNGMLVLDFDDSTDEEVEFSGVMPRSYAGGGIDVVIGWAATSATSGDVVWDVSLKSVTDDADDLDTKAFAAANSATATTASASGEVDYVTIAFTDGADMDSVAAGEYFRLKLNRDANNASDTMVGDAELVFIYIEET